MQTFNSNSHLMRHAKCLWRPSSIARPCRLQIKASFTLTDSKGKSATYTKAQVTIGSSSSCDIRVTGPQVAEQHATIIQKGKHQTFLKSLVGEDMLDDSRTWQDGEPLRPRVSYVLASGCKLAFGTPDQVYTIAFEEGTGSNPLVEMMMKGMLANSSVEVKKALGS
ncbi:hypothetical protein VOLCADRAFT_121550 [Volvox carteri f. nagariensis]|uniref:FHA domain-containing protein n=1 Tax=Volvox carteri f. nagariensis TaxID=3068 RepID=D8UDB6_VOLCA|nr:uncharacterized protein VOLCADRAFT_121550 [Volvox carteri f. nagariensis]EFJ42282.1 hypothetical protein VOLCADRAFT_121550 [Volvox carteri f. nagariensis]|eukprot:XP_002956680.1 hypothetical protein VOLCADRAFT_121550 [Volvox carteri f. nagariensis]